MEMTMNQTERKIRIAQADKDRPPAMTTYTVAVREKGKTGSWLYFGDDGHCHDTTARCKPLDQQSANWAKARLIELAAQAGRPITARVVVLAGR
jgi:hypothetical protein